jgi:DNA-binding SARP family transcriptional activator
VHLDVLGEFRLQAHAGQVAVRRGQQRLLAFLAVSRRPVPRSTLSQRLWDPVDERRGSSALRSNLWRLPRPTGDALVTTSATHVALSDTVVVDLWQREQLAKRLTDADQDAAGPTDEQGTTGPEPPVDQHDRPVPDAHALWTDDLLPEWADDWLMVERESYRQVRLHALEHLSHRLLAYGQHSRALTAALAAVQADPLRESAHRAAIAVHLAEGNSAEALREFHGYRRLLARELGLPPSPAIREQVGSLLGRPLEHPRRRQP